MITAITYRNWRWFIEYNHTFIQLNNLERITNNRWFMSENESTLLSIMDILAPPTLFHHWKPNAVIK